jgi:hypothetical protein
MATNTRKPQIIEQVLGRLAEGASLRESCLEAKIAPSTYLGWVEADEALAEQYARARATGADLEFDKLGELAAEPPPLNDKGQVDSGWVQWKRMQIDTAKWTLSKKRPERYGDRIDVTSGGKAVGLAINIDLKSSEAAA